MKTVTLCTCRRCRLFSLRYLRSAVRAASRLNRNRTQTERAFASSRSHRSSLWLHSGRQRIHRFHYKEKYDQRQYDERNHRIDELTDEEFAPVNREKEIRETETTKDTDERGDEILDRSLTTAPKAAPITIPTARSTTLPRRINVLNSFYDEDVLIVSRQQESALKDPQANALEKIELIANRFHTVARQLLQRHRDHNVLRDTLRITDEYDVQDLFHALLRLFFDDVRDEEWTSSYAGGASSVKQRTCPGAKVESQ